LKFYVLEQYVFWLGS